MMMFGKSDFTAVDSVSYVTPYVEVFEMSVEGVLCASTGETYSQQRYYNTDQNGWQ